MSTALIEVKDVTVKLDQEVIHSHLSFAIKEGEMFTILGPNGSGKSVLLKVLLGLLPHSGHIIWHKKPSIGYLPQSLNLQAVKGLPLTVKDYFDLKDGRYSHKQVMASLTSVGLDADIHPKPLAHLSGGQFQRLLVAWTIISHPNLLILDEPTTGIDIGGGENIYALLDQLRRQMPLTIVLVTHDINIVYAQSDTVLCLRKKDHACFGPPRAILTPQLLEDIFGMKIKFYQHH